MNKELKEVANRISIPARVMDLLWTDDEFYREISSGKRFSGVNKFPRCDQWCDGSGFHMAFALAGYSSEDISVEIYGDEISVCGGRPHQVAEIPELNHEAPLASVSFEPDEEYPSLTPSIVVQRGMIVRGIARRSFKVRYFINPAFNVAATTASMKNGLLQLTMPRSGDHSIKSIKISEI